jgi:hypothetical protein
MDEKQLAKLIRQNQAKALIPKVNRRVYDATLPPAKDDDTDIEREQFFKEMKRREF